MAIDPQAAEQHAALMAITHALTTAEGAQILATVDQRWPRLRGAKVPDILEHTVEYDMFLDKTEPFFEKFGDQIPECGNFAALIATHVLLLLGEELYPATVIAMLQKAGVTAIPNYPEVEVGIRLADGGLANSLLIFARAEQAMRAAGVPASALTVFRLNVRQTGIPGQSRNVGAVAKWVTLVNRYTPVTGPQYDPVHDLAVILVSAFDGGSYERTTPELAQAMESASQHIALSSVAVAEEHLRALLAKAAL